MKLETLQKRLDSNVKHIEKANNSIDRITKLIPKKLALLEKAKTKGQDTVCEQIEYNIAKDNLQDANKKLEQLLNYEQELLNQMQPLLEKEVELKQVLSIDAFSKLSEMLFVQYLEEFKDTQNSINNSIKTFGLKETAKRYGANIILIDKTEQEIEKIARDTAKAYVQDLIIRINKKCGDLVDFSNIKFVGKALNGTVEGTKGNAIVETIVAGGHNIQRLHYRVLVK